MRIHFYYRLSGIRDDNNGLQDLLFRVEPPNFMILTFIQVIFTIFQAYSKQYTTLSIVEFRIQIITMVGYNGILFQDDR